MFLPQCAGKSSQSLYLQLYKSLNLLSIFKDKVFSCRYQPFFFLLYFTLISGEEPCHGYTDIKPLLLLLLLLLLPSKYLLPHRIVPSVKFSHRFSFKSHLEHFQPLKKRTWLDIKEGAVSLNTMIIHPLTCS